jgi:hypothetical protein
MNKDIRFNNNAGQLVCNKSIGWYENLKLTTQARKLKRVIFYILVNKLI